MSALDDFLESNKSRHIEDAFTVLDIEETFEYKSARAELKALRAHIAALEAANVEARGWVVKYGAWFSDTETPCPFCGGTYRHDKPCELAAWLAAHPEG